ncbi:hypothetical protein DRJ58_04790, partial [Candidatus Acetothermia bacterium]
YIVDEKGNRVGVLLDWDDYRRLLEALEELEWIEASGAANAFGEVPVPFDKAIEEIERSR